MLVISRARPSHIEAPGISSKAIYARTVEFNGGLLRQRAISHEDLTGGGRLRFNMSESREIVSRVDKAPTVGETIDALELRIESSVEISFVLAGPDHTSVTIYDMLGRRVALIADDMLEAGTQRFIWEPEAKGAYTCVVSSGGSVATRKIVW